MARPDTEPIAIPGDDFAQSRTFTVRPEDSANDAREPHRWDQVAASYNDAVGRSTRIGAARLIEMAAEMRPLDAGSAAALDMGAGTGSTTHVLAERYPDLSILATDISPEMLQLLGRTATPNVRTHVADMAAPLTSGLTEGAFSHIFSTMAIQFISEPADSGALTQWARLLQPDGVVAIGIWDMIDGCGPHEVWEEAARAVDPAYKHDLTGIFAETAWVSRQVMEEGLRKAGWKDIRSELFSVGFNVGTEAIMGFFKGPNPAAIRFRANVTRQEDLPLVFDKVRDLLDHKYNYGTEVPLRLGLAVARRPTLD